MGGVKGEMKRPPLKSLFLNSVKSLYFCNIYGSMIPHISFRMKWKLLAHLDLHDLDLNTSLCFPDSPPSSMHLHHRQSKPPESLTQFFIVLSFPDLICLEYLLSPLHVNKMILFLKVQVESPLVRKPFLTTLPR